MWPIVEFTLKKLQEGTILLLLLLGFFFCALSDSATSMNEQVESGSLLGFALGSQSLQIPPLTSGTFCVLLFTILISVFLAASDISGDRSSGMLFVLLSKPISRTRYVLGKYFGLLIFSCAVYFLFQVGLWGCHFIFATGPARYDLNVFLRQLLPLTLIPVLIGLTMNFSIVIGSMGAMVFTVVYMFFSALVSFLPLTVKLFPKGTIPGLDAAALILHYCFPNLFYFIQDSVYSPFLIIVLLVYMLSLVSIFVLLMNILINRIDLHI